MYNQFDFKGEWLCGNLYCHLKEEWEGEYNKALYYYSELGHDFIAGMDHDEVININSLNDILVLLGMEGSPIHFLAFGLDDYSFLSLEGNQGIAALLIITFF